jgi:hypothetical protein
MDTVPLIVVKKTLETTNKKALSQIEKFITDHAPSLESLQHLDQRSQVPDEVLEKLSTMKNAIEMEIKSKKSSKQVAVVNEDKIVSDHEVSETAEAKSSKKRKRQK